MPSKEPQEEVLTDEPPTSINPYEVLGLEEKVTADEIKRAYRKQALKHHPDKASPDQIEEANKKFQEIAFAYAILSDERRRRRYDQTGNTSESLDLEDDDFDWASYYKEQFSGMVDSNAIEKLKKEYQGSEDERTDLLEAFEEFKGSMNKVFDSVMLSSVLDDEERFRGIIDKAIKDGEVEAWPKYVNETEKSIKARRRRALKEKEEAEALAEELEIDVDGKGEGAGKSTKKAKQKAKKQPDTSDLAALIQQKQSKSSSFLDRLEAKYAQENGSKSGKKGKKRSAEDEPPEEAFAAVGARLKDSKQAKKRRIPEEEIEEEETKPTKRSRRTTKKAKA
ncbi:hypothetical protein FQN54_004113 [Arachnomyces sp. PD_36]|nr:hypothetical protein FQN54_004113 [Arachnomyces sp. PD_36]